jgi:hypothetical protein
MTRSALPSAWDECFASFAEYGSGHVPIKATTSEVVREHHIVVMLLYGFTERDGRKGPPAGNKAPMLLYAWLAIAMQLPCRPHNDDVMHVLQPMHAHAASQHSPADGQPETKSHTQHAKTHQPDLLQRLWQGLGQTIRHIVL